MTQPTFKFELGVQVKDEVSEIVGVVITRSDHLNGCNRYVIERPVNKDGKMLDLVSLDEARLTLIPDGKNFNYMAEQARAPDVRPGGPPEVVDRTL